MECYSISKFIKESLAASEKLGMCKREQNFQVCLTILLNPTEFSAKILQKFCPCNQI